MDSHDHYAPRIEELAELGRFVRAFHAPSEQPLSPEHRDRLQVEEHRSRSEKFAELRRLGAVDFYSTTDPAEAGT